MGCPGGCTGSGTTRGNAGGTYRTKDLGWTSHPDGTPADVSNPVILSGDPATDVVICQVVQRSHNLPAAFDAIDLPIGARVAVCMDPARRAGSPLFGYLQMLGFAPQSKPITPGTILAVDTDEWQWIGDTRVMVRDGVAEHPGWS